MILRTATLLSLTTLVICLACVESAVAQAPAPAAKPLPQGVNPGKKPQDQSVTITQSVRPAFLIDPIVNRLKARRGQTLPVEFGITCEGTSIVSLELVPVALTQDVNGSIYPNTKVPAPPELEITTPLKINVTPGEKYIIRGRVKVPSTLSTFHTYGLLVRDAGQLKDQVNPEKADGPRIGIRFVTQYLLRCDVSVEGVRAETASKLKFDGAELVEVDGVPLAKVYVTNPTDGPIEFGMRAQIRLTEEGEERPTFPMWMPVRSNMDEPDKFIGRILPGARIGMMSPLNSPVFPGQYFMEASLMADNRVLAKSGIPVVVQPGQYPAQGVATIQAAPGILATPSQIELSLQRGGSRAEILALRNEGDIPTDVEVTAESLTGEPIDWVLIRPAKSTLTAGSTRKVSVSLTATGDQNAHRYARLRLKSTPAGGTAVESTEVIVAGLGRTINQPILEAGQLVMDTEHGVPALAIPVKNVGPRHMAIDGQLTLSNADGKIYEIRGGFGKWALPGATETVRFNRPLNLEPGRYLASLAIPNGEGSDPIVMKLDVDIAAPTR